MRRRSFCRQQMQADLAVLLQANLRAEQCSALLGFKNESSHPAVVFVGPPLSS
jgi:hypothetical protein